MSVRVYLSGDPEHDRVLQAFYDGCPRIDKALVTLNEYEPSDVAVIFGVRKKHVPKSWPRGQVFLRQREKNLTCVVLETGYVNRGGGNNHHYAAGFNGLNGRADFRNKDMPEDRAALLREANHLRVQCWSEKGEHVVLCGQVPWDASVNHTDHLQWLHTTARQIKDHTKRPVVFRPHPLGPRIEIPGTAQSVGRTFADDLEGAHAVVTFNSNSGVEALIAGIPVFADDAGSMVYAMAARDLAQLEDMPTPDRRQWLNNLAYTQWTPAEMAEGLTWGHLFRE